MKKVSILLSTILLIACLASAQTAAPTTFSVHEDIVKPSMDAKFRETMKKLKAACELHKTSFGWSTIAYDDNSYRHLAPLKSFSELEKNPFAELETKMGKEALGKIWADFDECIESHSDFVAMLMPNLSYLSPAAGENYRDIMYWYALPGKEAEAEATMVEWKKLYESKKAPNGFLIYKVMFGRESGGYAVVSWGKDRADADTKSQKTDELIGVEAGKLWAKTLTLTKKYNNKRGSVLPEFSYNGVYK